MEQWQEKDYRLLLKVEFERRCARNPSYSLRSFARDLAISPSCLSDVLNGKYGFSSATASKIAIKLNFSPEKHQYFVDTVESKHGRSAVLREQARLRLEGQKFDEITAEAFAAISNWYHFAILELTKVGGFRSDVRWIAQQLDIPSSVVSQAIERLLRLNLLSRDPKGHLQATSESTATPDGVPNEAIREFHKQVLEKAILAIDNHPLEHRSSTAMVTAVDARDIDDARACIKSFRRSFDRKFGSSNSKNAVYCLAIQFFGLSNKPIKERRKL